MKTIKYIIYAVIIILFFSIVKMEIDQKKSLEKYFVEKEGEKSVIGGEEDPFGALKYRSGMLKDGTGRYDPSFRRKAIEFSKANLEKKKSGNTIQNISSWEELGPGNIGGRIKSILIRPSNSQEILIGSAGGGFWKSYNGGNSWRAVYDDMGNISISCMTNIGDVVYAGTGEGWVGSSDGLMGDGIYKSTDFGETWTLLSSTAENPSFYCITDLETDPNGNIYAATYAMKYSYGGFSTDDGGLFRSTDGGTSWTDISPADTETNCRLGGSIIPVSESVILYATLYDLSSDGIIEPGGIFRTINGGVSWTQLTNGLPNRDPVLFTNRYDRIELVQSESSPNIIYAVFSTAIVSSITHLRNGLRGIYKTSNYGLSWEKLSDPPLSPTTLGNSYLGLQGWYDNVITVSPSDPDLIYAGGTTLVKTTDGGNSWTEIIKGYDDIPGDKPIVHVDFHAIAFDPSRESTLFFGNDGGVYLTYDGGESFTNLNVGLSVTQFFSVAVSANDEAIYAGAQDNGTNKYIDGINWYMSLGGDGGYTAIEPENPSIVYAENYGIRFQKSMDGGATWTFKTNGINNDNSLFYCPFLLNPENPEVLIFGTDHVYVTFDKADEWILSSPNFNTDNNHNYVSAVEIVNSSAPYLAIAGSARGKVYKSNVSESSFDEWTEITPPDNNGGYVRGITVNLNNKNEIFVCYGGYNSDGATGKHIYRSGDGGTTWEDISVSLPNAPVHSIAVDRNNDNILYAGSEIGVFQSNDKGVAWIRKGEGMPDYVPVNQLFVAQNSNVLYAATHGRGVFRTIEPLPVELSSFTAEVVENEVYINWETATETNNYGFEIQRCSSNENDREFPNNGNAETSWRKIGFVKGNGTSISAKYYSFVDERCGKGKFKYRLKQIDTDGSFEFSRSIEIETTGPEYFEMSQNYPNPFNPSTTIKYSLAENSEVNLTIFNILGEKVATLVNERQSEGVYVERFSAANAQLTSGTYIYRLLIKTESGKYFTVQKKMILMK
ncbi:MAG: T9SS type A sorting domain-containing protein [Chlorobi bacterium]|nr:T9SS type A sorting domain-containing protein [Chlorobiota bacterium]